MALKKEIKPYTYFSAPFVRRVALSLANAGELKLLKCRNEMVYNFNEISGLIDCRFYTRNMVFAEINNQTNK